MKKAIGKGKLVSNLLRKHLNIIEIFLIKKPLPIYSMNILAMLD